MTISFEPNDLFDFLYKHLPSFVRYNNRVDEYQLVKLRKDSKLEVVKERNLIPQYYNQEDYYEFIEVLNKFKRKIHNAKFNQDTNYRKTKNYREKSTFKKMEKYNETRDSHNEYCRLYNNTNYRIINHWKKHKHSLFMIKSIGFFNNKNEKLIYIVRKASYKKNINLKMISLSYVNYNRRN